MADLKEHVLGNRKKETPSYGIVPSTESCYVLYRRSIRGIDYVNTVMKRVKILVLKRVQNTVLKRVQNIARHINQYFVGRRKGKRKRKVSCGRFADDVILTNTNEAL